MKKEKKLLTKLLYPPIWMRMILPFLVFPALIYIFVSKKESSVPAYVVYAVSAYCLIILIIHIPKLLKSIKSAVRQKISDTKLGGKYLNDLAFRGNISIYQGMLVNFFYVIFRITVGILHASVWFITIAVYYLILGGIRLFLVHGYRHCNGKQEVRILSHDSMVLISVEYPHGSNDTAYGMEKQWLFLSRICYLYFSYVHFLYNDNISYQSCAISQTWKSDFISYKSIEFHSCTDVFAWIANCYDCTFFGR